MNKIAADNALFAFAKTAEYYYVTYFLALGTCLGFVRDGGYIQGDNDIDVGVRCSRAALGRFFAALETHGFTRGNTFLNPTGDITQHFRKGGILIDVFYVFQHSTEHFLLSFDNVTYEGRQFNVPYPIDEYLTSEFGDWRTPIPGQKSREPGKRIEYLDFGGR